MNAAGLETLDRDALVDVSGGGNIDWRSVRQAAAVGAISSFGPGAIAGAATGGTAGAGIGAIPGAVVGGLVGAGIGAVTAGMASFTGQLWVKPAMQDSYRGR